VAKRGEQKLADLYGRHASDAVRLAFLLTGDQHAAEDIVQDAFARLFGRFQELRARMRLRPICAERSSICPVIAFAGWSATTRPERRTPLPDGSGPRHRSKTAS
jgi:Sigma-70 region 2